jgi:hypothetical protein
LPPLVAKLPPLSLITVVHLDLRKQYLREFFKKM